MLFALDGKVYIAKRQVSGDADVFRYLGLTDSFEFGLDVQKDDVFEKEDGQRLLAASLITSKKGTINVKCQEATKDNLALAFWSTAATITAGTVTAEVFPPTVVAGNVIRTKKPKISAPVLKDSTGAPKTLVLDTNYKVLNADLGSIEILELTTGAPYVMPLKLDYSNAAMQNIPMFGTIPGYWWLRFEGIDRVDGAYKLIELYNCDLDPLKQLATKGGFMTLDISGGVLYDSTKAADPVLGQFGRVVIP